MKAFFEAKSSRTEFKGILRSVGHGKVQVVQTGNIDSENTSCVNFVQPKWKVGFYQNGRAYNRNRLDVSFGLFSVGTISYF